MRFRDRDRDQIDVELDVIAATQDVVQPMGPALKKRSREDMAGEYIPEGRSVRGRRYVMNLCPTFLSASRVIGRRKRNSVFISWRRNSVFIFLKPLHVFIINPNQP